MKGRGMFLVGVAAAAIAVLPAVASAPTGAIFTTVADGSEVNVNQFPSKADVYLDGGPGIGAPQTAAGLDDGRYVFQVTDPSGKVLLSTDNAICRQFDVLNGIITNVVATGCEHNTGLDVDHGATTVQLIPYLDTPNNGGVYKAWATKVEDFLAGCVLHGFNDGLNRVDCEWDGGNAHGFVDSDSKTDNFKVKVEPIREIDAFFIKNNQFQTGLKIKWIDTLGASNQKFSYLVKFFNNLEAHVEAVEDGVHKIVIEDQPNCIIDNIYMGNFNAPKKAAVYVGNGAQTVPIRINNPKVASSPYLNIYCK